MSPKYQIATKTAVSTQTKVLVAVIAVAALGLAAVGYGYGYAVKPSKTTFSTSSVAKIKSVPQPSTESDYTAGIVQQISPLDRPVFTKMSLASTVLKNSDDVELFKFKIAAKNKIAVSWKQLVFNFEKTPGLSLSGLRLWRGPEKMDTNDYEITCLFCGGDVKGEVNKGTITSDSGLLIVTLKKEEWVYGNGKVFALSGNIEDAKSGSNLTISLYRSPNQTIGNGYLTNNVVAPLTVPNYPIVNIDMTYPPKQSPASASLPGIFVWASSSTSAHSFATGLNGGSSDWFNDTQVESTQLTQNLSL